MRPIIPLTLSQCWKMISRVNSWPKMRIAELWLMEADITIEEFDDLMTALFWIGEEIARS